MAGIVPVICCIGLNPELVQVIAAYIGHKYQIIAINRQFSMAQLDNYSNILLLLVDTDQVYIEIEFLLNELKKSEIYKNIPMIGLSHKKHFPNMDPGIRKRFEDIILLPNSYEDLLTRIEVWVCTYQAINEDKSKKTFSIDEIKN